MRRSGQFDGAGVALVWTGTVLLGALALTESFAELTVSLDGPETLHDRLRGASDAYARVRDGVRALVAERQAAGAPLRLRANVVLMRDTLPHVADLCETLADWGMDEITFNQLGGRDRPEFFPAQRLQVSDVQTLSALLPDLLARLSTRGVRLCADGLYLHRLHASAAGVLLSVPECQLGREFLFVDEHGIIAPCSFSGADYGVPIASVRTIGDIDQLHARFRAAEAARRCAACNDCPSTRPGASPINAPSRPPRSRRHCPTPHLSCWPAAPRARPPTSTHWRAPLSN